MRTARFEVDINELDYQPPVCKASQGGRPSKRARLAKELGDACREFLEAVGESVEKYDPGQERDEYGRWTSTGAGIVSPLTAGGKLTARDLSAIKLWSRGQDFYDRARNPHSNSEEHRTFLKVLGNAPRYSGLTYRGLSMQKVNIDKVFPLGRTVSFQYHSATSKDIGVAEEFAQYYKDWGQGGRGAKAVLLEIAVKTGADISRHVMREFKSQKEVVIKAKTRFKVVSIRKDKLGFHLVSLKEL